MKRTPRWCPMAVGRGGSTDDADVDGRVLRVAIAEGKPLATPKTNQKRKHNPSPTPTAGATPPQQMWGNAPTMNVRQHPRHAVRQHSHSKCGATPSNNKWGTPHPETVATNQHFKANIL